MITYKHNATSATVHVAPNGVKSIHKHGMVFRSFTDLNNFERTKEAQAYQERLHNQSQLFEQMYYKAKGETR